MARDQIILDVVFEFFKSLKAQEEDYYSQLLQRSGIKLYGVSSWMNWKAIVFGEEH